MQGRCHCKCHRHNLPSALHAFRSFARTRNWCALYGHKLVHVCKWMLAVVLAVWNTCCRYKLKLGLRLYGLMKAKNVLTKSNWRFSMEWSYVFIVIDTITYIYKIPVFMCVTSVAATATQIIGFCFIATLLFTIKLHALRSVVDSG